MIVGFWWNKLIFWGGCRFWLMMWVCFVVLRFIVLVCFIVFGLCWILCVSCFGYVILLILVIGLWFVSVCWMICQMILCFFLSVYIMCRCVWVMCRGCRFLIWLYLNMCLSWYFISVFGRWFGFFSMLVVMLLVCLCWNLVWMVICICCFIFVVLWLICGSLIVGWCSRSVCILYVGCSSMVLVFCY